MALECSVYSWDACWLRWHCQVAKPATSHEVSYSRCGESLQSSAFRFRACCVALVSLFKQLCNKTCTRAENACFLYYLFLFIDFWFHLSQCKPICTKARLVQDLYSSVAFQTRCGWRRYLNWICACMQPWTRCICSLSRACASICEQNHLAICTVARKVFCKIMIENFSKETFCLFRRFSYFEGFTLWSGAAFLVLPSERLLVAVWWCSLCCLSCACHLLKGTFIVHLMSIMSLPIRATPEFRGHLVLWGKERKVAHCS